MGRHRRSGAAGAAGPQETQGSTAPDGGTHRHRRRGGVPVRTGLLGVSAAVALGAAAVATGVLPGGGGFSLGGGDTSDTVRAGGSPSSLDAQGGRDARVDRPSHSAERSAPPSKQPSAKPSRTPSQKPSAKTPSKAPTASKKAPAPRRSTPAAPPRTERSAPPRPSTPVSGTAAAAAKVLSLVNQERAGAGCSPVASSGQLTSLAQHFSEDMAARGFFDHTDPDGASPWDRAAKAGVTGLGGENIARGQADAAAVMKSWMNSPGHRANILNCDYKTLGVGVHFGSGGPWWTQDFGF
ncbi:CAP domain-containing protein [Streptomyces sp. NPDC058045]|uniref:CAP domain-containing protein n=1 Tax=Streptomyces sp. NPDC058045 TaxID=3346311 RepID=UPI0036E50FD6